MAPEPTKRTLNPETPITKQIKKIPLPPLYKHEWDIVDNSKEDTFIPKDLDKPLDTSRNEDNNENNS